VADLDRVFAQLDRIEDRLEAIGKEHHAMIVGLAECRIEIENLKRRSRAPEGGGVRAYVVPAAAGSGFVALLLEIIGRIK
jgi:hypothetical protein